MTSINPSDKVKVSVYTLDLTLRMTVISSRSDAEEVVNDFNNPSCMMLLVRGRLDDANDNAVVTSYRHSSVGAVEILELSKL